MRTARIELPNDGTAQAQAGALASQLYARGFVPVPTFDDEPEILERLQIGNRAKARRLEIVQRATAAQGNNKEPEQ